MYGDAEQKGIGGFENLAEKTSADSADGCRSCNRCGAFALPVNCELLEQFPSDAGNHGI